MPKRELRPESVIIPGFKEGARRCCACKMVVVACVWMVADGLEARGLLESRLGCVTSLPNPHVGQAPNGGSENWLYWNYIKDTLAF
jgi:hypothetical protein